MCSHNRNDPAQMIASLKSPDEDENKHDNKDQPQPTRRIRSPAGTVRPTRQGTDQQDNQNDEKNCSNRHFVSPDNFFIIENSNKVELFR